MFILFLFYLFSASNSKIYQKIKIILILFLDAFEVKIEVPSRVDQRVLTYSSYKSNQTFKVLIGITPGGIIIFISKSYGGRTTDGHITNDSKILNLLQPGDEIMADKGKNLSIKV